MILKSKKRIKRGTVWTIKCVISKYSCSNFFRSPWACSISSYLRQNFYQRYFFISFLVYIRVSVQGVKSLGGHFAFLCRGFDFYEVKMKKIVIIFQKENGNTSTLLIIFIVKSLQKEQNSTNLLL